MLTQNWIDRLYEVAKTIQATHDSFGTAGPHHGAPTAQLRKVGTTGSEDAWEAMICTANGVEMAATERTCELAALALLEKIADRYTSLREEAAKVAHTIERVTETVQ